MENENIFQTDSGLKIDLGCGSAKKTNFIGVDVNHYPGVDYAADLEEGLGFISDNSVDEYFSSHFLEHVFLGFFQIKTSRVPIFCLV